ncbi:hypothetical protein [Variovorax sp. LT1R16]|uniref:hypothetical protein n=1 Tax=Variovorax sp. LT1R16 TaxID=3443728 RepID=UPI003F46469E
MPSTTQKDVIAVTEDPVAQARTVSELRLIQIDVEEARAVGKTDSVASTLAAAEVH